MELLVLDTNFVGIDTIDVFEDLIWTDRYSACGDFELHSKMIAKTLSVCQKDYYLWLADSPHIMIIENLVLKSDVESGDSVLISGRSLESILDRRIIWTNTVLSGNLQNGIKKLLDENAIIPAIPERAISNLVFEASTDVTITTLTLEGQYSQKNLYETICEICDVYGIGFRITLSDENQFVFKLFRGVDRSYNQLENPYVVFSPKYDNLLSADYSEVKETSKTVALVLGEGEPDVRKMKVVGTASDLTRREICADASDLSQKVNDVLMTDEEYLAQLEQRGYEILAQKTIEQKFDAQVDTQRLFRYGEDFMIGDIVQFESGYGLLSPAQIIELIHSQNASGEGVYPKFKILEG